MEEMRRQLVQGLNPQPYYPLDAYTLLFGRRVPQRIELRTRLYIENRLKSTALGRRRDGWIYCFYALDGTLENTAKIGFTRSNPHRRLAQWAHELGHPVTLLFAYRARDAVFAEGLIHRVLTAERAPHSEQHINPRTGGLLVENFTVDPSLWALKLLVKSVIAYANGL